jgi:peptide methionine sulfoxide reductase MsrA
MGGNTLSPDYNSICTGATGHLEVVKVEFDDAEDYHQDYYDRHQKVPYCHSHKKIF